MRNFLRWALFVAVFLFGCTKRSRTSTNAGDATLPEITTFFTTPSDQFILDSAGLAKISRAFPYKGASTACAHSGGHLHFTNVGAPYTVDIIAPAAGTIGNVDPCYVYLTN